jgi:hypothetical protein
MTHPRNGEYQQAWRERQAAKGLEVINLHLPKRLKLRIKTRALALGVTASELVRHGMEDFLRGKA